MHGNVFGHDGRVGAICFARNLNQRRLRSVVVRIAATRGVNPTDAGKFNDLSHAVEEVVLEFAERAARGAEAFLSQQFCRRFCAWAKCQRLGDVLGKLLKVWTAGHRGTFALEFDHRADLVSRINGNSQAARTRFAVSSHGLCFDALFAEPLHGLFGVSATFRERFLALHHRKARFFTQAHHRSGTDISHGSSLLHTLEALF